MLLGVGGPQRRRPLLIPGAEGFDGGYKPAISFVFGPEAKARRAAAKNPALPPFTPPSASCADFSDSFLVTIADLDSCFPEPCVETDSGYTTATNLLGINGVFSLTEISPVFSYERTWRSQGGTFDLNLYSVACGLISSTPCFTTVFLVCASNSLTLFVVLSTVDYATNLDDPNIFPGGFRHENIELDIEGFNDYPACGNIADGVILGGRGLVEAPPPP